MIITADRQTQIGADTLIGIKQGARRGRNVMLVQLTSQWFGVAGHIEPEKQSRCRRLSQDIAQFAQPPQHVGARPVDALPPPYYVRTIMPASNGCMNNTLIQA